MSLGECIYMPNYDFCHSPISARLPASIHTVGILHSDDAMHYDHVRQLGRFWNRVVTVSQRIAETCRAIDVPADKLLTIPYGIPIPSEPRQVSRQPANPSTSSMSADWNRRRSGFWTWLPFSIDLSIEGFLFA